MNHQFHPSVLREYDIRGTVGQTLGPEDAYALGRSFATRVLRDGRHIVAVGYDGRLSSPMLEEALVAGLCASGVDVRRIGLGPTPMLYFATASLPEVQDGIQITGSHNPADQNGFKVVFRGGPFFGPDILDLGRLAARGDWAQGDGTAEPFDIMDSYVERLLVGLEGIAPDAVARLAIGWDAGNGAAGPVIERLCARLPARIPGRHVLLHTRVDGTFPNHHPDPSVDANLADLRDAVAQGRLDFGLAFDGDGDRLGVVDANGRAFTGDALLLLFAEDLLKRQPGATVVADIKASGALFERVRALGGSPLMWKSGHSHIKSKMKETGALLGGEVTGHVFLADDYYGFDDALYAAVRLIAACIRLGRSVTELHDAMPVMINTPELRFPVEEDRKFVVVDEVRSRLAADGADLVAIDGVRVTTPHGWWLLRASNTEAMLTARAESESEAGLAALLAALDAQLAASGIRR
ncbi:phosphoglucomutase/phosphomannomutase PgmG [Novosphingobium sp.]|uniref:phosphoglucomutase/phosphomannomutase PgmG n=1 Tax=Novosphingobium sp. TaxID=1874826 RepID=UPI001DEDE216|nr:phosphomannomutase/phosphoglucomutase [Novosphingobium sp.]MBX9662009.1 phosphomannomutase/phosphoglucomutase [Novosphingobium sp.]